MSIYNQNLIEKKDKNGAILHKIPNPAFLDNIETLEKILELILHDWLTAQEPYEDEKRDKPLEEVEQIFMYHYVRIQPLYLKCLFSYVMIFWSLKLVYDLVYSSLNTLNRESNLMVRHPKPPVIDPFIQKVKNIRDLSVAHIGSHEVNSLDSFAAYNWKPLSATFNKDDAYSLENIEFGSGTFTIQASDGHTITSLDLYIKGLKDMHNKCCCFIKKYDQTCVEYLHNMQAKMPYEINDIVFTI